MYSKQGIYGCVKGNVLLIGNENRVNAITGRAGADAKLPEMEKRRYQRIDAIGDFTHNEANYNPSWYSRPRFIQFGIGLQF